ncbi:MAG: SDR family oxidoreductase [Caulobacterales bacterium]|nr:SDR family oxidoreductase [Caulobacterales bacterium]
MDLKLTGRKVIIAGASRGIGLATAQTFAREGADVAICARGPEGVEAAVASLAAHGRKAVGEAVNMADGEAYRGWIARAAGQLGGCDIFIPMASAGGGPASEESWKAAFDLDLMGVFRGVEAATPYLEQSDAGSVVAVSTTAALEDFAGPQPYNAVKAGVINYISNMSRALAPKGVRFNTVSPGPIYIDGGAWAWVKDNAPDFYNATLAGLPMGRFGNAEEVANAIVFAASPAVPFMTGANIVVDGAYTKRVQY